MSDDIDIVCHKMKEFKFGDDVNHGRRHIVLQLNTVKYDIFCLMYAGPAQLHSLGSNLMLVGFKMV